jgi:hypothetical protein
MWTRSRDSNRTSEKLDGRRRFRSLLYDYWQLLTLMHQFELHLSGNLARSGADERVARRSVTGLDELPRRSR